MPKTKEAAKKPSIVREETYVERSEKLNKYLYNLAEQTGDSQFAEDIIKHFAALNVVTPYLFFNSQDIKTSLDSFFISDNPMAQSVDKKKQSIAKKYIQEL